LLEKPFSPQELSRAVRDALDERRRAVSTSGAAGGLSAMS
jgi:hypothetical protein